MNFLDRFRELPPATKNLLIINTIIFLLMSIISPARGIIERYGALYYFTSNEFLPTQLFTYMFIHANFWHLFFNMFSLWMFGVIIERTLGTPKFLVYYISCGLGAALLQEGVFALMIHHYASHFEQGGALCGLLSNLHVYEYEIADLGINPNTLSVKHIFSLLHTPTVGASGAIYGILLAFGFLYPQMRIYLLFPPIPMKARTAVIVFAGIELLLGIYNSQADTVAHFAHLGGMLVGLAILLWWKRSGNLRMWY